MGLLFRDKDLQSWGRILGLFAVAGSIIALVVGVAFYAGQMSEQHRTIIEHCGCRK